MVNWGSSAETACFTDFSPLSRILFDSTLLLKFSTDICRLVAVQLSNTYSGNITIIIMTFAKESKL